MDLNTISANIRRIRQVKGLSQENVADILNISRLTFGEMERGHKDLSIRQLEQIAKVLETDITVLFDFPERAIFNQNHNEKAFASYQSTHKHQDQRFIQHLEKENEHLRSENAKLLDILGKK